MHVVVGVSAVGNKLSRGQKHDVKSGKQQRPPFWRHPSVPESDKGTENLSSKLGFRIYHDRIDGIRILGERHSGTSFLTRYLQQCFPHNFVDEYLVNGKHWFQPSPEYVVDTATRYGESALAATGLNDNFYDQTWWQIAQSDDPKRFFNTTLVIALFRNPYDWIEGMRRMPHHWPNHVDLFPKNKSTLAELDYKKDKRRGRRGRRRRLQWGEMKKNKQQQGRRRRRLQGGGSILQKSFVEAQILNWDEFVARPMYLTDYNEQNSNNNNNNRRNADTKDTTTTNAAYLCQKGYPPEMVTPCDPDHTYIPSSIRHIPSSFLRNLAFEVNDPTYEFNMIIDSTSSSSSSSSNSNNNNNNTIIIGQPFRNPMELRAAKIINLIHLEKTWDLGGFAALQYDDILGTVKLQNLITKIETIIGIRSTCPNSNKNKNNNNNNNNNNSAFHKLPYNISSSFRSWIRKHTDWTVEAMIGFSPLVD